MITMRIEKANHQSWLGAIEGQLLAKFYQHRKSPVEPRDNHPIRC
jgi:hypothetical protein